MTAIKPTIFLVKENIKEPRNIFKKGSRLPSKAKDNAILFYRNSRKHIPEWAHFVDENFDTTLAPFRNSSSYAVLVLKIDNRLMAIPFGMGFHLIDLNKMEYNFGLKTAINCIPKNQIRQLDTTTPEINSQKTKKQAVVGSTPEDFGVNKQKDILRGIVGRLPKTHVMGQAVEGKDSFRTSKSIESMAKLKSFCKKVLDQYTQDTYKKEYPWIDNIALVRDQFLIDKLTKLLVKSLKSGKFEHMMFAPPVFYEQIFDCNGFVFSTGDGTHLKSKDSHEMPSMADWKKSVGDARKSLDEQNLDSFKVNLIDEEGGKSLSWPLQKCLSWETDVNGNKYVLTEGNWYIVATSFFREVEDYFKSKISTSFKLPAPSKSKIKESDYNQEICKAQKGRYLFDLGHLTAQNKTIGSDRNEACDVYDVTDKSFFHIKMGKSSPSLSHLFRQGAFSAQAIKQNDNIRKEFNQHLIDYGCDSNVIAEPFQPWDYNVVFAIVIGKRQKPDIPFFSKVSFRDVSQNLLELMAYKCHFVYVVK